MKNECSAFAISCRKHDHVHDSVGLLNGNTPDSLILAHAPSSAKLFNKQDLANSFLLASRTNKRDCQRNSHWYWRQYYLTSVTGECLESSECAKWSARFESKFLENSLCDLWMIQESPNFSAMVNIWTFKLSKKLAMSANWRYLVSHALSQNLEMNLVTDLGRSESEIEMSRLVVHESMEVLLRSSIMA